MYKRSFERTLIRPLTLLSRSGPKERYMSPRKHVNAGCMHKLLKYRTENTRREYDVYPQKKREQKMGVMRAYNVCVEEERDDRSRRRIGK
mmetsp:Transcript_21694/g.50071  ORF Transcript_21694/g.50071 Transcript_21694/m.50071 type:complete len:90 (+) Transcript_21694:641-910(+)